MKKYTDEDVNEFIKQMKEFEKTVIPEHLRGEQDDWDKEKVEQFQKWVDKKTKNS